MTHVETREIVLDVAQEFVQTRGFSAFSFRDVAERVQIRPASIHYYFPTKFDLCRALIERQRRLIQAEFERIDREAADDFARLTQYSALFQTTLEAGNRMCLCGMLASDLSNLTPTIIAELRASFQDHEDWLEHVLTNGRASGLLEFQGDARLEARLLVSSLEGALLISRTFEDLKRYQDTANGLVDRLRRRA